MHIHHLFLMAQPDAPEAGALQRVGLKEGPPNIHTGQGTANRRFFFRDFMLELLYIEDEQTVQSEAIARTRLWQRAHWQDTGWAPVGICLLPGPGEAIPFPVWNYSPPYLPEGTGFPVAENEAFPGEPMIFLLPPVLHRKNTGIDINDRELKSVAIGMPPSGGLSSAMQWMAAQGLVSVFDTPPGQWMLRLDWGSGNLYSFLPILPLEMRF